MKKLLVLLCSALILGMTGCSNSATPEVETKPETKMTAGTYEKSVVGMHGPLTVSITVDETSIVSAEILDNMESPGVGDKAAHMMAESIVASQSLDVDTVAGATITSSIVLNAFEQALAEAGADIEALKAPREREYAVNDEYTSDVVIIGGGGAGVTAAVTALQNGSTVTIIEKTDLFGGNSILAGGFMNASVPELQSYLLPERSQAMESLVVNAIEEEPVDEEHAALQAKVKEQYEEYLKTDKTLFDSPDFHALQTWNGGDKIADLKIVERYAHEAPKVQQWLIDQGLEFRDKMFLGGGALYSRSRFPAEKYPSGTGYFALYDELLKDYDDTQFTKLMSTTADELIVEDGRVVGVKAHNTRAGKDIVIHANNGVIMATGGFAGNVELRVKYCQGEKWPDLGPNLITTNTGSVTGDGIFMAEKAGANLVNMEQIQLLPYCNPETGVGTDTYHEGQDYLFINKEGNRFVREDGRRDEMAKGIIAQTDGVTYMLMNPIGDIHEKKTLSGISVDYLCENNISGYCYAETLEEIAEKMGVPYENIKAAVDEFVANAEADVVDEFGRVTYATSINPDGPFIALLRAPACHHTMGGIDIDEEAHVLDTEGKIIPGFYAAGEVTGNLHGGNRLGGNAISDFLVFGRISGTNASNNK